MPLKSAKWWLAKSLLFIWCILPGHALGATQIGISLDKSYFSPGEGAPTLSISAFNDVGPLAVDVHVGVIGPDGTFYEYPDWNTKLTPVLKGYTLPQNFTLPPTPVVTLPAGLPSGIWTAFAALTQPGTINLISFELAPFNILPETSDGSITGFLFMSQYESPFGIETSAGGEFARTSGGTEELIEVFKGEQPDLDQCVLNEMPLDLLNQDTTEVVFLDAGESLQLSSSAGLSSPLLKDLDAESLGFIVYTASATQLGDGFYQGGQNYTFQGPGGLDISAFSVSLSAPAPLSLTQPAMSSSVSHNAASDLSLAWKGNGGIGEVNANLTGSTLSKIYKISCRFVDDGSASIPSNLITQLKEKMSSDDGTSIPDIPGLPPGIEIPDEFTLPVFITLDVSRTNYTMFNTAASELGYGIATIDSGAVFPQITLE